MEKSKELEGVLLKNLSVIFQKFEDLKALLQIEIKNLKGVMEKHHASLDWVISVLVDLSSKDDIEILEDADSQIDSEIINNRKKQ